MMDQIQPHLSLCCKENHPRFAHKCGYARSRGGGNLISVAQIQGNVKSLWLNCSDLSVPFIGQIVVKKSGKSAPGPALSGRFLSKTASSFTSFIQERVTSTNKTSTGSQTSWL